MISQWQLMISGQLYNSSDEDLVAKRHQAKLLVYAFNHVHPDEQEKGDTLLNQLVDCPSKDAYIETPFRTDYGINVHIGKQFYANYECIFLDTAPITIGDNVMLGPRVSLYTAGHPIDATVRNEYLEYGKPIAIGDNVWIGGNAVVCPGVTIGSDVVIGAGAIVTKDVADHCVVAGNPARVIRPITKQDEKYWSAQKAQYFEQRRN